jgi:bifunctional non-homologous end joining protein LigD
MRKVVKHIEKLGRFEKMPRKVKPMLCTLLAKPFNDDKYIYEIKWDGYRIIAYKNGGQVTLESRSNLDYSKKYPSIINALGNLKQNVVLDGEVVTLDESGKADFDELQTVNGQPKANLYYYVFDLLWYDGVNVMDLPLIQRKLYLKNIVKDSLLIRFSDHFDDGLQLYELSKSLNIEGIIAKRKESKYVPDSRGNDWYKIPNRIKQEFVVGGWVESSKRDFKTLLFGAHDENGLRWIGHAGGGYKEREMPGILKRLTDLETKKSPFYNKVEYDGIAHYVRPELVANIEYSTLTKGGKIRKPAIFLGFREDKKSDRVVEEKAKITPHKKRKLPTAPDSNWPLVEAAEIRNTDVFDIDGHSVALNNVDWEIWKGITKADLIQYYHTVSRYILPHLKDRPLSLHIKLKGPFAKGFFIKDMEGREPRFAKIFQTKRLNKNEGMREVIDYLVCNNLATLLYAINLPTIDLNPWTSTIQNPEYPNYIVLDLDPSDDVFSKTIEPAIAAKELFDREKITAFIKTSGKTGIHIFVPCSAYKFEQARTVAENMSREINSMVPRLTTIEFLKNKRGNKVYIDINQNDFADTVAAPYSVRPYRRPNVSTPLKWKEVNPSLSQNDFTIKNTLDRFEKTGDLFEAVLDKTIALRNNKKLKKFL